MATSVYDDLAKIKAWITHLKQTSEYVKAEEFLVSMGGLEKQNNVATVLENTAKEFPDILDIVDEYELWFDCVPLAGFIPEKVSDILEGLSLISGLYIPEELNTELKCIEPEDDLAGIATLFFTALHEERIDDARELCSQIHNSIRLSFLKELGIDHLLSPQVKSAHKR